MTDACSRVCRELGEPLAGSAGSARAVVAFSWPKPLWDPDEVFRSRGLPAALPEIAAREQSAGRKVAFRAFQRAPAPPTDRTEVVLFEPRTDRCFWTPELELEELPRRIEAFLAGDGRESGLPRPLLLVCTDGRHDRCCAQQGFPVFEALRREVAERGLEIDVAESSHLGGHRFAATTLLLPQGHEHGRLTPDDAAPLVEALARGGVLAPRYRGRTGQGEPQQVAEVWARARFPTARSIEVGDGDPVGEELRVPVAVDGVGETLLIEVRCRRRLFAASTSCGDEAPDSPRPRWVAISARDS